MTQTTYQIPKAKKSVLMVEGPFDTGVSALREAGLEMLTAAELAALRLKDGPEGKLARESCYIAECPVYDQEGNLYLTNHAYSPILRHPAEAVAARRAGKEYIVPADEFNALEQIASEEPRKAIRQGVLLVRQKDIPDTIKTEDFRKNPITKFLFRNVAANYGAFLKANGRDQVTFYSVSKDHSATQTTPFARGFWACGFDYDAYLGADDGDLDGHGGRVCGVRREGVRPAEQAAPQRQNDDLAMRLLMYAQSAVRKEGIISRKAKLYFPVPKSIVREIKKTLT